MNDLSVPLSSINNIFRNIMTQNAIENAVSIWVSWSPCGVGVGGWGSVGYIVESARVEE